MPIIWKCQCGFFPRLFIARGLQILKTFECLVKRSSFKLKEETVKVLSFSISNRIFVFLSTLLKILQQFAEWISIEQLAKTLKILSFKCRLECTKLGYDYLFLLHWFNWINIKLTHHKHLWRTKRSHSFHEGSSLAINFQIILIHSP